MATGVLHPSYTPRDRARFWRPVLRVAPPALAWRAAPAPVILRAAPSPVERGRFWRPVLRVAPPPFPDLLSVEPSFFLDTPELRSLRAAVLSVLPDVVTVTRSQPGRNRQGGVTSGDYRPLAEYRCRLQPRMGQEGVEGGRIASVTQWRALLPYDADVRPTDRLTLRGQTYEVTATSAPMSEALELRVDLRRIQ